MGRLRTFLFVIWLLLGFVTICAVSSGFENLRRHQFLSRLEDDGVLVEGKVAALRQESPEKSATEYFVSYRFRIGTDAEGEEVTREESVDGHRYVKIHEGDTVTVRYSRSDPSVWDIPDGRTAADALSVAHGAFTASIVAGVMFVLLGPVLLYLKGRSAETKVDREIPKP